MPNNDHCSIAQSVTKSQTRLRKYLTVFTFVCEYLKCLRQLRIRYTVIRLISAPTVKAAEIIHQVRKKWRQLYKRAMVQKWVRALRNGRPLVNTAGFVQKFYEEVKKNRHFSISLFTFWVKCGFGTWPFKQKLTRFCYGFISLREQMKFKEISITKLHQDTSSVVGDNNRIANILATLQCSAPKAEYCNIQARKFSWQHALS